MANEPKNASDDAAREQPNPIPLDYQHSTSGGGTRPASVARGLLLGFLYSIVAVFLSYYITDQVNRTMSGSYSLPSWWWVIPAMLLGVPFLVAMCFHGWRAFAMGILISTGLSLLVIGTCAAFVFRGLSHA